MGKFGCKCGHIIHDQTDALPHKADVFKDEDLEPFYEAFVEKAQAFVDAVTESDKEAWLDKHFSQGYPKDVRHGDVLHDLLTSLTFRYFVRMYECGNCGRLWIQTRTEENRYISFVPESGSFEGVLKSQYVEEKE